MVLLSMNTGMRRGELRKIQWTDVDFDKAILTIRGGYAKSGQTRYVPLNVQALDVLRRWKAQSEETGAVFWVLRVDKSWKAILKRAKIEEFRWHDLRHHFASRLVQRGVDLNTVRELLGHADISMTLRYSHLAPEHKAEAVAKLAA
jgi:integrase